MSNSPLLPLLEKLVSFRSVDGQPEEKKAVVDFVENWLRERELPVERVEVENEAPALSVSLPGNGAGKPILFLAHLDVVPAEYQRGLAECANVLYQSAFRSPRFDDNSSKFLKKNKIFVHEKVLLTIFGSITKKTETFQIIDFPSD
jgi:hypothetical protein